MSVPTTAPIEFVSESEGKGSAAGAVFKKTGRPSVVLTGDILARSADRMTGDRKKGKGFHLFRLACSI